MFQFLNQVKAIILKFLKFFIKDIKMPKYITDDVEMSSDESSEEDSDRNLVIKKILLKKILMLSLKRPILEKQFEKMFGDIL